MQHILLPIVQNRERKISDVLFFMRPLIVIAIFVVNLLFAGNVLAQTGPSVSNISDNRGVYPASQVPKNEKFEITFDINNTSATNLNYPYDPNPPAGIDPGVGITVNAEFSSDNWVTVLIQPAFIYQSFDDQVKGGREWFYPINNRVWKARLSPDKTGNWKYRIRVVDSSGSATSPEYNFSVGSSSNRGFIRISQDDPRYFEFEDGSLFTGLGYNMNYRQVDWVNPVLSNQTNFTKMKENGINFIRIWLSQWSIFGSTWNPWKSITATGGDPPLELLVSNVGDYTESTHEHSIRISPAHPCIFHDSTNNPRIAVKRNTLYRVRALYFADNLVGTGGFVVKKSSGFDCASATSVTQSVGVGSQRQWRWLEGEFTTGTSEDFIVGFFLNLENITSGNVRVAEVQLREVVGGNTIGPNLIEKPTMDHTEYFDQRNSYAFDKLLDLAKQNDVYLRPVTLDHREWIFNHTNHSGQPTGDFGCTDPNIASTCPSAGYLYGDTGRADTKNRWLQKSWWKYIHARWGYSTNVHSWEYVNEGTTGTEHAVAADIFGQYFDSFNTNRHLTSTSSWNQQRSTASHWGGFANYPGIDFADIHTYFNNSDNPNLYYDLAQMTIGGSSTHGASNTSVQGRFPVVRGEAGLHNPEGTMTPELQNTYSTNHGLWLHNYIWATLNPGALYESSWWWPQQQIYPNNFDIRPLYKPLSDFLSNIPLNKGGYADAASTGFDTNAIRVTGQKNTASNKAHLWVQNKKHTWCAVSGNVSSCPAVWDSSRLSGTISISGFAPNQTLPIEYWYFDNSIALTKQVGTISSGNGTININLSNMPATVTDAGIKIGNYSQTVTNTPTPTTAAVPGDGNGDGKVDGVDYIIWLTHYNQNVSGPANGDFDNSGVVDGVDYVIWLNNYGL